MEIGLQFPKNLQYKISQLAGFSKTTVKLTPDRTEVKNGESFRVKLPANTIFDLRSLCMYASGTCVNTGNSVHFPRLGLSACIKSLRVYINGTLIENIAEYGTLYNALYNLDGGGIDQTAKRNLELADPSIRYKLAGSTDFYNADTPEITTQAAVASDTNIPLSVNQWLGFISSASTACLDSNDFGVMELEFDLQNETVLWAGATASAANAIPVIAGAGYTLKDIYLTVQKITFNSSEYYNLKASKLLSSGLQVAYQTYICSKGSKVAKSTSVSVNATVNSTSLDQLIACFGPVNPSIQTLLLFGSNNVDDSLSFNQVLSGYNRTVASSKVGNIGGQSDALEYHNSAGDAFNQSYYFKSDATSLSTSSWEINNTPLMPTPLEPSSVFNETLIALGNNNLDMSSGVHQGCRSLAAFCKYYFTHIVSLENISKDDSFYRSGLDGKSSALNIVFKQSYKNNTGDVVPYIYAKCTRLIQINEGHQITVIV
jgi:hypothetical protein